MAPLPRHLLVYVPVNAFLVVTWAVIDVQGFFWPVFLIAGWGIGVVMKAWDAYWRPQIAEQDIQRESARTSRARQRRRPAVAVFQYGETRYRTGPVQAAMPGSWRSSCGHEDVGN